MGPRPATAGVTAPAGPVGLLSLSSAAVGGLSYACSLALAHLLAPAEYTVFAAAAALVGTAGIASAALVPLPLATAVRRDRLDRDAVTFAVATSLLAGVVAATALAGLTAAFGGAAAVSAVAAAALSLFLIAPLWGVLQGEARFTRYAGLTVAEVATRLVVSVVAAALGAGAAGALWGFTAGAAVVVLVAGTGIAARVWHAPRGRHERRDWVRVLAGRARWAEVGAVTAVQVVLSGLAVADAVVATSLAAGDPVAAAGYQAVATVAKAPIYLAVASGLVSFPRLRAHRDTGDGGPGREVIVRSTLRAFARLLLPAAALVAALALVPAGWARLVLPAAYVPSMALLPLLAVAGAGLGTVTVVAMLLLATREWRRLGLGLAVAVTALAVGLHTGTPDGPAGLARGGALGATVGALALILLGRRLLRAPRPVAPGSPHVLHLAFEDPEMPGSGGGALRTAQIDGRLAALGHRVTVLTTRFPGARDRVEHHGTGSVTWIHIGPGRGRTRLGRLAGYVLAAPWWVRSERADLVVEDFCAPFSSMGVPWWTSTPTVGIVQWLNAREKAREYHVPVHLVERLTVRSHRRLIAMSHGVADRLAVLSPGATVHVIGNGVDPIAAGVTAPRGDDVVFVGRLETAQKGLDLLLDAWAQAAPQVRGTLVVAGTGPDGDALRARVDALGIGDRVRFAGWVAGEAKFRLLASARVAVVPSRFETFGIVAVEALATGTPVLAYDIDCLREVVPDGCGVLVPVTGDHGVDATAYAAELVALHRDDDRLARAARRGPVAAAAHDWDALALAQAAVLRAALDPAALEPASPTSAPLTSEESR